MRQTQFLPANLLAEQTLSQLNDVHEFMTVPDVRSISFNMVDGEQVSLHTCSNAILFNGRYFLMQQLMEIVRKHLRKECKKLKRMRRKL